MPAGRLLLFWDYDTEWGAVADRARNLPVPAGQGALEFENTERLLELHAEYDVPACFAVVGEAASAGSRPFHDPAQIRQIHAAGHEVASHSHRHEWIPGLGHAALTQTLHRSRSALEDCIGAAVTTFVPPYNQPFDHARALSFSRAERRQVPSGRIDLRALCGALARTGYRFCRVAYRPLSLRLADRVAGRWVDRPGKLETIEGIVCSRLNTPGGFAAETLAMVERTAREGGIAVVYGHPHSLTAANSQNERWLVPFFERVRELRRTGRLEPVLPRECLMETVAA